MPDDFVSLKEKPYEGGCTVTPQEDYYPSVYVADEVVKALGLEKARVGDDYELVARVNVSSVSAHDKRGGGERRNVTLELREGKVRPVITRDAADVIYGK